MKRKEEIKVTFIAYVWSMEERKKIRKKENICGEENIFFHVSLIKYESNGFFDQTTLPGNVGLCGKQTVPRSAAAFTTAVEQMLSDLRVATPKINGFFAAAAEEKAAVGGGNVTVYGVAQCARTVSSSGCLNCLQVAYANLQSCLPDAEGRAVDAGCFLRYSNTSFFADNQTTNLDPFLNNGQ
ncbi:Gnk2-like domain containing protein [Trema orientale]|uniref:Gnk2-like domain containing protein n=1 Tax=Trema orientale TaxID=63057 RepID=A0A2P5G244_TREOI|nr:Gnk2-like domain containing protein [Trema orientale]